MSDTISSYMLSQLVYVVPALLVYLVAGILALVFMERARTASLLTLFAALILALTTVGVTVAQGYLFHASHEEGWRAEEMSRAYAVVGIAGTCARTLGMALLVAAVFVGRQRPPHYAPAPGRGSTLDRPGRGE